MKAIEARTSSLPPLVGMRGVCLLLGADRTTIYRWMDQGRMIPSALVESGDEYADALLDVANRLREDAKGLEPEAAARQITEAEVLEDAAEEALKGAGRPMWCVEDIVRFGPEVRYRSPQRRAKMPSSARP